MQIVSSRGQNLLRQLPVFAVVLSSLLVIGTTATDPANEETKDKVDGIERLIGEDIGNRRGIGPLTKQAAGGLFGAAESIAQHPRPHVCILTGFYFPFSVPPSCETDGPPGAAHLAFALHNAGIPSRVATDVVNEDVVLTSLWGVGTPGDYPVDIISMNELGTDGGKPLQTVLGEWHAMDPPISHVIALERGGPASDGKPHNFAGDDISAWNAPLDVLFTGGDWVTIGIGDGGNELGMGNLPHDLVAEHVPRGETIGCVVRCDYLIVCGTSNWGGWALPAALALLRPDLHDRLTAGLSPELDYRILQTAVEKGHAVALESFESKRAEPGMYVDALPWSVHAHKLDQILQVLGSK